METTHTYQKDTTNREPKIMFQIKIPVYIEIKSKTYFLSMNAYRNWHYFTSNKIKQLVEEQITAQFPKDHSKLNQYTVTYIYNYKSKVSDLPNVCALASKYLNDAMKTAGLITDDNVQYLIAENYSVGYQSKEDPHILAFISEIHETNNTNHHILE